MAETGLKGQPRQQQQLQHQKQKGPWARNPRPDAGVNRRATEAAGIVAPESSGLQV
jgi:hypothetical protein